ncbi:hypothetical protein OP10G_3158 [Fimbriimonas ginsengisoli Gsoil 348]|uniref:Uncharacterized protein n=1 Tax=Fimbriimonas ginsengisoli Gsoil 348 TaxID=661478 RepID=A0A068NSX6_FIMGI|nr:hypothetical protein OP10G_3158 [Fimbriimonas ginsengisoli Gsoil 348]
MTSTNDPISQADVSLVNSMPLSGSVWFCQTNWGLNVAGFGSQKGL